LFGDFLKKLKSEMGKKEDEENRGLLEELEKEVTPRIIRLILIHDQGSTLSYLAH
jgi:hypothetical protein